MSDKIRVVRILVYEGTSKFVLGTMERNAIKGRHVTPEGTISEAIFPYTDMNSGPFNTFIHKPVAMYAIGRPGQDGSMGMYAGPNESLEDLLEYSGELGDLIIQFLNGEDRPIYEWRQVSINRQGWVSKG